MNTTQELLEQVKAKAGVQSDYALAKCMGWGYSKVSNYRVGRSQLDVDACFAVAEILGRDPAAIIAAVEADRATKPEARAAWIQRLKQLGGVAAMWGFFAVSSALPAPAEASSAATQQGGILAPHYPDLTVFRSDKARAWRCIAAFFRRFRFGFQQFARSVFAARAMP